LSAARTPPSVTLSVMGHLIGTAAQAAVRRRLENGCLEIDCIIANSLLALESHGLLRGGHEDIPATIQSFSESDRREIQERIIDALHSELVLAARYPEGFNRNRFAKAIVMRLTATNSRPRAYVSWGGCHYLD
jgi:hypothetical protein